MDLNQCYDAPIVGSFPHYYLSGPELQEMFGGFSPQKDTHYMGYDFELVSIFFFIILSLQNSVKISLQALRFVSLGDFR